MSEKSIENIDFDNLVLKAVSDHGYVYSQDDKPITLETKMSDVRFEGNLDSVAPILDIEVGLSEQLGMEIDGLLDANDVERAASVKALADLTKAKLGVLVSQIA